MFLNKLKNILGKEQYKYYGLVKEKNKDKKYYFKLLCLFPRPAFTSLTQGNDSRLIFTSGSLPDSSTLGFLTGLKFGKLDHFTFDNIEEQRYLCVKKETSLGQTLKLNFEN